MTVIKDAADITTLSNEEDGVAYAIEKYALKIYIIKESNI